MRSPRLSFIRPRTAVGSAPRMLSSSGSLTFACAAGLSSSVLRLLTTFLMLLLMSTTNGTTDGYRMLLEASTLTSAWSEGSSLPLSRYATLQAKPGDFSVVLLVVSSGPSCPCFPELSGRAAFVAEIKSPGAFLLVRCTTAPAKSAWTNRLSILLPPSTLLRGASCSGFAAGLDVMGVQFCDACWMFLYDKLMESFRWAAGIIKPEVNRTSSGFPTAKNARRRASAVDW